MIKALFFDSGNVLAIEGFSSGIAEYEKINSIPAGKLYASAHDRGYWKNFTLGKISEREYFSSVAKDFSGQLNTEKLRGLIYKNFSLNQPLLEFIKTLKGRYALGVISNNPKEMFEYLSQWGHWDELFSIKAVSAYLGVRKPDKKIYQYALEQAGIPGEQAVYIDDRADRIEGAEALGIKIIIYKDLGQLKIDFKNLT